MNHAFPRVYRMGGGGLLFYVGLGAVAVVLSGVGFVYFAYFSDDHPGGQGILAGICAAFALLGAYTLAAGLRMRVTLTADAIELQNVFSMKRMQRDEIAGHRLLPLQYGPPAIKLFPRFTHGRALTLPQYLKTDAAFHAWFATVPDMDAEESKASLDELLDNPELEGSKQQRLEGLGKARRVAQAIRWIAIAACAWVWLYPHPYELSITCVALIPWIAVGIAARGGALYRINPSRNDVGADLSLPLMTPGFVLMLRALLDTHVLDWEKMLAFTIAASAVVILVIWRSVRELRGKAGNAALIGLLMMAYAFGALTLANMEFDRGKPVPYAAKVLGSHVSSGKTTSYYLNLGPWGPRREADDVDVGRDYYERGSHRETVCVYLFDGALDVRWYEVWDCPES